MSNRSFKLIYFVLVILTVFFMINRLMLQNIVILLILLLFSIGKNGHFATEGLLKTIILIAVFILLQLAIGSAGGLSNLFSTKEAIKEIERSAIYVLLLLIVSAITIEADSYIRLWRVILSIVVGISILQYVKVFNIDAYLRNFYGSSVQFYNSAQTSIALFRGGSVFINPNVLSSFLIGFLGNYLAIKDRVKEKKYLRFYTYVLIAIGLILAGSRTGLLVAIIEIMIYTLFVTQQLGQKSVGKLLIIGIIIIGLVSLLTSQSSETISSNYRAFDIQSGFSDSLSTKLDNFKYVMNQADALNYMLGFGPFDYSLDSRLLIDFEVGYFIAFYGVAGFFFFVRLLKSILLYGRYRKDYSLQRRRNLMFVVSMLLYGFTAAIYLNLRMFPIYIVLFFPKLYFTEDTNYEEVYPV